MHKRVDDRLLGLQLPSATAQASADLQSINAGARTAAASRRATAPAPKRVTCRAFRAGRAALHLSTCLLPATLLVPDAGAAEQACTALVQAAAAVPDAAAALPYSDIHSLALEAGAMFITGWIAVQWLLVVPALAAKNAQHARMADALERIAAALEAMAADGSAVRLNGLQRKVQPGQEANEP